MTRAGYDTAGKSPTASRGSVYLGLICFVATLGGLLFGYDTAVIAGAIGFLQKRFALTPIQEGWAAASALAGCVLGAALAGTISDHLGRRKMLLIAAVLFLVSAVGTAVPPTLFWFVVFRLLGGIGVGAASMSSPMYIAEISPARIRGRMVSLNQLAIVFGMLAVYFVNYFIAGLGDETWNVQSGWRWMFGSEALPALVLLGLLLLVPESPRWLVEQGRRGEALDVLARINGPVQAQREIAEIERAIAQESGSLQQLLLPGLRLALTIGVVLAVLQQITGINVFLYFAPEIFKGMAGARSDAALLQTVVVGAVNMLFTVVAIWTVDRWGRKPLMIVGFTGMAASLLFLGLAAYFERKDAWVLIFMLGYIASFALSVGPVTWVILSEIFPTRIRGRAMAMATVCLWTANLVISQTFPMMDKSPRLIAAYHHAFPFWLYGVFCVVAIVFVIACVPETKGRTLEEIEKSWGA
ncbi:MAG TPA: sugar porter family MFS transporter [Candidatus Anammoximicrobium sp.]|nr:sugar porter family MFS transporter [Candidatus Anammoximicrobium sp.]